MYRCYHMQTTNPKPRKSFQQEIACINRSSALQSPYLGRAGMVDLLYRQHCCHQPSKREELLYYPICWLVALTSVRLEKLGADTLHVHCLVGTSAQIEEITLRIREEILRQM